MEQTQATTEVQLPQYLLPYKVDRVQIMQELSAIKVVDEDSYVLSQTKLPLIAKFRTKMESERTKIVKPINDQVSAVNNQFKLFMSPLLLIESRLRTESGAYYRQKEEERLRLQREADAKAAKQFEKQIAKGQVPAVPEPVAQMVEAAAPKVVKTDETTSSMVKRYAWDYASEADKNPVTTRIPKDKMLIDEKKIGALIRSKAFTKSGNVNDLGTRFTIAECPGIVVYEDYAPTTRSTRE